MFEALTSISFAIHFIRIDFVIFFLQFCGHVKSCLRAEDPTTKKPKGFGFYEFESAEDILRAIRLLTQRTIDGQELLVIVDFSSHFKIYLCFFNRCTSVSTNI